MTSSKPLLKAYTADQPTETGGSRCLERLTLPVIQQWNHLVQNNTGDVQKGALLLQWACSHMSHVQSVEFIQLSEYEY